MNQIPAERVLELIRNKFSITNLMTSPPRDSHYYTPSPEWISGFGDWLKTASRPSTAIESWDCDDHAMWASVQASSANRAAGHKCGHCVFIAYIYFEGSFCGLTADTSTAHATLLIIDNEEQMWFLEPQTGYSEPVESSINDNRLVSLYYVIV